MTSNEKIKRLEKVIEALINGADQNLDSSHMNEYAGYFEEARIMTKNATQAQKDAFIQIQRLLNGEDGHFRNQNIKANLNESGLAWMGNDEFKDYSNELVINDSPVEV